MMATSTNLTSAPAQTASRLGKRRQMPLGQRLLPYLLVLPTLACIFVFTLFPTARSVVESTFQPGVTVKRPATFVGVQNYRDLFDSTLDIGQDFPRVLNNTLIYVGVTVPISMVLAFGFALALNQKIRLLGLFRFAFFYPVLMPMIGAGSVFAFLFADSIGLVNTVIRSFGLMGIKWVGDANWTLITLMIVAVWKQTGFFMILYLAGLQNLPQDVYEAADLDGASGWQKIRSLTLPLLSSTTLFILTTGAAAAFQLVDHLYALGEGQPNQRSNQLLYFIFQKYNEPRNLGYVNAMTVVLLGFLLVFTAINFLMWERQTYYES
jgi:sn-glycerol 3-phosphate transport system permease protein